MTTPLPRPRSGQQDDQTTQAPTTAATGPGWFGRRIDDLDFALTHGWRPAAAWIKTVTVTAGLMAAFFALRWLASTLLGWAHALPWTLPTARDHTGLLATIDQPVHHYLAAHTAPLPITAATAYSTWQAVGVVSFLLGTARFGGARLTWTAWGAATVAMVWAGTPEPGRPVAAGIALLAWAAPSLLALRGLSLSPTAFIQVHNQAPHPPEVRAEIHLPKTEHAYRPYTTQQPPSPN
ncbi:hypothetical protein [Streptomyces spirodelae]|uniref:Uncharacterized protein n=1 Tax=Streptomyces spirodelae TaxID=2812904 RepID=A0ABS3X1H0_9ACTN|nr:hypothetical protein [Streptomyces spirodelae]MBO8189224.1 hypothetical protein [Streptomyces spirodelae]